MINTTVIDKYGINLASRFVTNRPAQFRDIKQKGRTPAWGLSYGTWRQFRRDIVTSKKRHTIVTAYMRRAKLDPTVHSDRLKFTNGMSVTFPGQTISTMRSAGKTLDFQGITL